MVVFNRLRSLLKLSANRSITYSVLKRCSSHLHSPEIVYPIELNPLPSYIEERIKFFDELKAQYDAEIEAKEKKPIKITLPDGKEVEGSAWKTTPYEVAQGISQGLADNAVIAKVNGVLWDLDRVLEDDSKVEILKFDHTEGQQVFWHSSAHILGEAMERHYGGCLCYGPPIEDGFYYDMHMEHRQVSSNDFKNLETIVKKVQKEKQPFIRLEMKKEDLLKMFAYNPFKLRILNERVTTPTTLVYRCGPLIDLCRGPHVRHTGKVKAMSVTKNSATYWEGNCEAESLQRIYGISFPNDKMLKEWKHFQEEAAKRDHRRIGKEQELFFFHELSPGSCFFLPNGAHIYNTLLTFIREEYRNRGFQEVVTPNIYSTKLWETSGHWQHYADNMFSFEVEKERYALKPMNCPGHCVMFDHRPRSWRELPLRMADFGVLHRNELSGALTGLTRVRRFQQDDAHIFCTLDQVESEIKSCLEFLRHVYEIFGFTFKLFLSTRPDKYLGELEVWNNAEKQLENSLNAFGEPWELNPADGAFYGPKIDIQIRDALRRSHQCATIQLDFQLPERFNLTYVSGEGDEKKRPVIIHRAILGSLERMIAILTENFGGKWPFWLSPRQAIVIPVSPKFDDYAQQVREEIYPDDFKIDVNLDAGETLNKKIRNAQLAHYNFILVVGDKEKTSHTVNVRTRDNKVHGEKSIEALLARFHQLKASKKDDSEEEF
ncbi:threonine--tRNA ligase 1, cytoplasmic-like isoform X2 [Hydractinia symbiolongicarpus]|uniref:threonine--tRNA ligase 1, cytoplasmic-like isoform X2 n=1 Tax=Hydractinia symbiolongicarpus TaxID=13093 RepID=UPI00254C97FD|nr:threonine--tRNA ligase 1, cytoplasmic-like isoform X2 [Hydractinia symbiolongicarpus]